MESMEEKASPKGSGDALYGTTHRPKAKEKGLVNARNVVRPL